MAIVNYKLLDNYLENNMNVLFEAKHGVGKTSIVHQVFQKANYKYLSFSASTLDPWVDLIGIPKEVTSNNVTYMDLIRPKFIIDDDIDAIFFDELNRADKKVLNAVMELIQFKSINGKKLNKLKVIWGAINPWDEDDTYSVTQMDPAQIDRFQCHIKIPFEVDVDYLTNTHGEISRIFCTWWKEIPEELRQLVSPRRLEYAIIAHNKELSLNHILSSKTNPSKLIKMLKASSYKELLNSLFSASNEDVTKFFKNSNNVTKLIALKYNGDNLAEKVFTQYESMISKDMIEAAKTIDRVSEEKNEEPAENLLYDLIASVNPKNFGLTAFITEWKSKFDKKYQIETKQDFENAMKSMSEEYKQYHETQSKSVKSAYVEGLEAISKPFIAACLRKGSPFFVYDNHLADNPYIACLIMLTFPVCKTNSKENVKKMMLAGAGASICYDALVTI